MKHLCQMPTHHWACRKSAAVGNREAADHVYQVAHHAYVLRLVGGAVLEHRALAKGHEEAEDHDYHG